MKAQQWVDYYQKNRDNRTEPEWCAAKTESEERSRELARSLSHFQLGETGGGSFLFMNVDEKSPDADIYKEALRLFVEEEHEHARLLAEVTCRLGGNLVRKHWTHGLFRLVRKLFGLRFEIQVLVIAELVGTAYYRWVERQTTDLPLQQVCNLLLKDEAMHVRFHREKLTLDYVAMMPLMRHVWMTSFQCLFYGALTAAWMDHGRCLKTIGVKRGDFFKQAESECIGFLDGLEAGLHTSKTIAPDAVFLARMPAVRSQ